jgi:hypothetical protein
MRLFQELKQLLNLNYDIILKTCKSNYQCNYSEFYNIDYIRYSLQNKQYVILKTQQGNKLLIGEDRDKFLYFDNDSNVKTISDYQLNNIWEGEAIIIVDKIKDDKKSKNIFIIDYKKSDWSDKEIDSLLPILNQMELGDYCLPRSPVILIFKNKTSDIVKEGIRAKTDGIYITIYDKNETFEAIFHELGHVFWRDVMNDSDRLIFKTYFLNLSKQNAPLIYTNTWLLLNEEEAFCNVYSFFLKGKYIDSRYLDILKYYDCEGYKSLIKVFKQIHERDIQEEKWQKTFKSISYILEKYQPKTLKIVDSNKNYVIKSFINMDLKNVSFFIPREKISKTIKRFNKSGIKIVEISDKNRENYYIPIDQNNIFRIEYMSYLNLIKNKNILYDKSMVK